MKLSFLTKVGNMGFGNLVLIHDTSLIYLNWMQVYQLTIDTILFYQSSATKFIIILKDH